ncbi:MAG: Zn-ribbon domain-containing OB-fold protein [Chloroflexi bacterium]|nr:Zn-ribbon domain-containing OB-fold protein [Chloroflexota bacterium]
MVHTRKLDDLDVFVYEGFIRIPNTYSAGAVGSRFLIEIRDNKKFLGTRCPTCNHVYVPARSICKYCFGQLSEWVEVSDKGTLLTYTVDCQSNAMQPVEPPIIYGIVQLDGADTGLLHLLGEVDLEQLKVGMRLQAVFKEKRAGSILDIKYFKPVRR